MFHTPTKVSTVTAAMTGRDRGITTRVYTFQTLAPSMRAASSKSFGMPSKNCLKMNTAITAGTCGKITDQ